MKRAIDYFVRVKERLWSWFKKNVFNISLIVTM